MPYKSNRRQSATMPQGMRVERSRVDLNAFLVVCFLWRADRKASTSPKPQPGALARVL